MPGIFRRGHVVQTAVWPLFIVFDAPRLYHFLSVAAALENMRVQAFVAEFVVEAFDIRVFPWTAGRDVQGLCPAFREPLLQGLGNRQTAIVGVSCFLDASGAG